LLLTQEENTDICHSGRTDVTTTKFKENTDYTSLAPLMAIVYSMVQQDYLMQVMNDLSVNLLLAK
jgi:hypothetical protein